LIRGNSKSFHLGAQGTFNDHFVLFEAAVGREFAFRKRVLKVGRLRNRNSVINDFVFVCVHIYLYTHTYTHTYIYIYLISARPWETSAPGRAPKKTGLFH